MRFLLPLIAFGIGAGGTHIVLGLYSERSPLFEAPSHHTGNETVLATDVVTEPVRFVEALRGKCPDRRDLARTLGAMEPSELLTFAKKIPVPFWVNYPSALTTLQVIADRLEETNGTGSAFLLRELVSTVDGFGLDAQARSAFLAAAVRSYTSRRPLALEDAVSILQAVGPAATEEFIGALLPSELWMRPSEAQAFLQHLRQEAGWSDSQLSADRIAAAIGQRVALDSSDEELLILLGQTKDATLQPATSRQLARTLAALDPQRFSSIIRSLGQGLPQLAGTLLSQSGLSVEYWPAIVQELAPQKRSAFLDVCAASFRGQFPEEVEEFAKHFPPSSLSNEASQDIGACLIARSAHAFSAWAAELSPDKAAQALDESWPSDQQARKLMSDQWRRNWIDARLALPNLEKSDLLDAFRSITTLDPEVIDGYVQKVPESLRKDFLKVAEEYRFFYAYMQGPEKALVLCLEKGGAFSEEFYPQVIQGLSVTDPNVVLKLLQETKDAAQLIRMKSSVIKARHWMTNTELQTRLCLELIASDPNPATYSNDVKWLTQRHTEVSTQAGLAFLNKLPEGPIKDDATVAFISKWAEYDPVSASDWIASAELGQARDSVIHALVSASYDDPEVAFANAAAIKDQKLRREAVGGILEAWKSTAPDWVSQLLQNSLVPREDILSLKQSVPAAK